MFDCGPSLLLVSFKVKWVFPYLQQGEIGEDTFASFRRTLLRKKNQKYSLVLSETASSTPCYTFIWFFSLLLLSLILSVWVLFLAFSPQCGLFQKGILMFKSFKSPEVIVSWFPYNHLQSRSCRTPSVSHLLCLHWPGLPSEWLQASRCQGCQKPRKPLLPHSRCCTYAGLPAVSGYGSCPQVCEISWGYLKA